MEKRKRAVLLGKIRLERKGGRTCPLRRIVFRTDFSAEVTGMKKWAAVTLTVLGCLLILIFGAAALFF